jgi:hypothetical protein
MSKQKLSLKATAPQSLQITLVAAANKAAVGAHTQRPRGPGMHHACAKWSTCETTGRVVGI